MGAGFVSYLLIRIKIAKIESKSDSNEQFIRGIKNDIRELYQKRQSDRESMIKIDAKVDALDAKVAIVDDKVNEILKILTNERKNI